MWDQDLILIFSFTTVIILIISGTAILWPFTRRLADSFDRYVTGRAGDEDLRREISRLRDVLDSMDQRLALIEDRVDFAESLMNRSDREDARLEGDRDRPRAPAAVDPEPASG